MHIRICTNMHEACLLYTYEAVAAPAVHSSAVVASAFGRPVCSPARTRAGSARGAAASARCLVAARLCCVRAARRPLEHILSTFQIPPSPQASAGGDCRPQDPQPSPPLTAFQANLHTWHASGHPPLGKQRQIPQRTSDFHARRLRARLNSLPMFTHRAIAVTRRRGSSKKGILCEGLNPCARAVCAPHRPMAYDSRR